MEILKFLEDIRTPAGDAFFSAITLFGEETLFIVIGILFFWCIDKRAGYYILSVGLIGTVINQFLKLIYRIPRPWVKDKSFTIVESAREEATGYSFPSGHTQLSVGTSASVALWNKNLVVRILCLLLIILVPFSRLYLGVHTLLDVGVSIAISLSLVFGIYPIVKKAYEKPLYIRMLFIVMTSVAIAYLLFVHLYNFPADTDAANLQSGIKKAYTMLGCIIGLWLTFEIDIRFIRFETKASFLIQILKLVLGFLPLLGIKIALKTPLHMLIGNEYIADGIRYFLMTGFAGCIWPLTFKLFAKLEKK